MTMRNSTKWVNGMAAIHTITVGPRDDPYSRTIVDIHIKDRVYSLVSCALAGDWLAANGEKLASLNAFAETGNMRAEFERSVIAHTGWPSYFWTDELWQKVEQARVKKDPLYYDHMYDDEVYGHA